MSTKNKQPAVTKKERPPIVVIMGHIDHGKTKLLDYIRSTNVVDKEAGGITQHIGAYEIEYNGKSITFIDTPGHEAFSKMRSRGANVADIAVLVVAAEEGVKPQTIESLNQIRAAGIPFLVAINKIDKPEANPERVRQQLAEHNVLTEAWGGNVPFAEISAKKGTNVEEMLDLIVLMAEMEELTGDEGTPGEGVVIESHKDPRIGIVATLLIRNGTVATGDFVVAGNVCGKIRTLKNFLGKKIEKAKLSSPVQMVGFSDLPTLGEEFKIFGSKALAETAAGSHRCEEHVCAEGEPCEGKKFINVVIKADVQGSKEAIVRHIEENMRFQEAGINILLADVGDLNEGDLRLAQSSGALIILFHMEPGANNVQFAETMGVRIIKADIIYELFDALEKELSLLSSPKHDRAEVGELKILGVFKLERDKAVVGGLVSKGAIKKGLHADIMSGEKLVVKGKITELQQAKIDTNEVSRGKECGLLVSGFKLQDAPDIKAGDTLVAYEETVREGVLTKEGQ